MPLIVSLTKNCLGLKPKNHAIMRTGSLFTAIVAALLCGSSTHVSAQGAGNAQVSPPSAITPQDMERFHKMEDSLVLTADSMYNAMIPDMRPAYSERFARQLIRTLKINNSYLYPFDTLQKMVNVIYADDNSFRIFNWGIEPNRTSKRYYGAIQLPQAQLKLIGLNDYAEQWRKARKTAYLPVANGLEHCITASYRTA